MAEYIDKETALSLVQPDAPEDEKSAVTIATAKKLVRSIIYRTPTADVAPVIHGKWISKNHHGYEWTFVCSNCGYVDGFPFNDRYNYCPNCGAKMDESEDKNEIF